MPLDLINTAASEILLSDGFSSIPMLDVASSNVGRIGYDGDARRLYVQFRRAGTRDGAAYAYDRVPNAVFEALIQVSEDGGSVGSAFNRLVKTAGFKHTRL